MQSGRTIGWSGRLDQPPQPPAPAPGRHRKSDTGADPAPVPPQRPEPESSSPRLVIDPLTDTAPVGGLHKFDLGMVPASVTPPPTWRRAAWFAIASSVAALGGLVFATTLVSSNPTRIEGLDLPSMPRGGQYPPLLRDPYFLTGDPTRPSVADATTPPTRSPNQLTAGPLQTSAPQPGLDTTPGGMAPGNPDGEDDGDDPDDDLPPEAGGPPTSEAPQLLQLTDTEGMKRSSERYYAAISSGDLPGAYAMTTGPLRAEGYEAFAARYSYATEIEVTHVYVTPTSTTHTLRMTLPDGSERTERRVLRYEMAEEPLIAADDRLS
ncbi:hypothetical protein EIL87_24640 [Saccharopolyspora rhizosphaerae]|uniref:Uncharacterized protein n=1 Tax=Saccharopolyspora rhizosphaerae TaxID=2492662 RepID=A0A3R8NTM4_9PSEU|nr:hypothetical protein [Saccharopolyspora rhizosphaerae]RRO12867.1 hypothetical protein EIL87_24640 [Saccharopolyspora rhizosphaerae]